MIRQNIFEPRLAEEVGFLPFAVMQPAWEALLITGISLAPLKKPGWVAARGAAVALATIAVPANPELRPACATGSLIENR